MVDNVYMNAVGFIYRPVTFMIWSCQEIPLACKNKPMYFMSNILASALGVAIVLYIREYMLGKILSERFLNIYLLMKRWWISIYLPEFRMRKAV